MDICFSFIILDTAYFLDSAIRIKFKLILIQKENLFMLKGYNWID